MYKYYNPYVYNPYYYNPYNIYNPYHLLEKQAFLGKLAEEADIPFPQSASPEDIEKAMEELSRIKKLKNWLSKTWKSGWKGKAGLITGGLTGLTGLGLGTYGLYNLLAGEEEPIAPPPPPPPTFMDNLTSLNFEDPRVLGAALALATGLGLGGYGLYRALS